MAVVEDLEAIQVGIDENERERFAVPLGTGPHRREFLAHAPAIELQRSAGNTEGPGKIKLPRPFSLLTVTTVSGQTMAVSAALASQQAGGNERAGFSQRGNCDGVNPLNWGERAGATSDCSIYSRRAHNDHARGGSASS